MKVNIATPPDMSSTLPTKHGVGVAGITQHSGRFITIQQKK